MIFKYHIQGMHCASCVEKIKNALANKYRLNQVTLNPPLLVIDADSQPSLTNLNNDIAAAGNYQLHPITDTVQQSQPETGEQITSYYPIFLIAAYIIGVATINNVHFDGINWHNWMNQFMAGFFLVFSAFKLLDIKGFAEGYSTYDLLASKWHTYGYIYPFLELSLGVLYIGQWFPVATNILTIIIMGFSSLGVINSLRKKQKFQCACLGTILKVPLSNITLIEDLLMVVMAMMSLWMLS